MIEHWKNKSLETIVEFIEDVGWVTEEWKDCIYTDRDGIVHNYNGLYKASNFGRFKTLGKGESNASREERIMTQTVTVCGYLHIALRKDRKQIHIKANRLIAQVFIPNPYNKPEVNHKRGNKKDNRVSQIEWNTKSENCLHAFKSGLRKAPPPSYCGLGKFGKLNFNGCKPVAQYSKDNAFIKNHESIADAARDTNVWSSNIANCCRGTVKSAGGFIWKSI
jgi:hypothetical protein